MMNKKMDITGERIKDYNKGTKYKDIFKSSSNKPISEVKAGEDAFDKFSKEMKKGMRK